jgi:hypothetical protein
MTEYEIQCKVAAYLDATQVLWTANAGGLRTSIGAAVKMKRSGYKKGSPDLMIFEPRGDYHGLFIEMKKPGGILGVHQKTWLERLRKKGYYTAACYSYDEAIEAITRYLKS